LTEINENPNYFLADKRESCRGLDLAKHAVTLRGQAIHLTPTEFNLLARLLRSADYLVTHRQLLIDV
jgi:DNA-binding response OmpR family regulator